MRVYLDACCLQRPLDDRTQPRVNLEAEAILTILQMVESGRIKLVSSEALEFEIHRTTDPDRRERATEMLRLASESVKLNDSIEDEAGKLVKQGFKPIDSLHLAFAFHARVNYFCSCDDKLLKKAKRLKSKTTIVSPLELVAEVMP